MSDIEEAKRLLGEAHDDLNPIRPWEKPADRMKSAQKKITDALPLLDNMEELEALKEPPTNYGTCGCHSVPGDSKTCKVHTARDYHFFLEGLEAGKEVMIKPPVEEPGDILVEDLSMDEAEERIMNYLKENPNKPLYLEEIATELRIDIEITLTIIKRLLKEGIITIGLDDPEKEVK